MSGAASLEQSRRLQDAALSTLGLYRFKVPEDGNCMFRAVACQLNLDQEKYHVVLREAASVWIGQHANELLAAGLLEGVGEMQDTATEGKWSGQAALVALANILHVNIAVVQGGDQGAIDIQHVTPFDGITSTEHSGIILAYLYNGHYDAVVHEPNISNPDYAVWSAKCHYNDAVSERVARKLSSEDTPLLTAGLYSMLKADNKSFTSSSDISDVSQPKVSSLQIDLQPVRNTNSQDSPKRISSFRHNDSRQRRPSVDNVKEATILQQARPVLRPSKSEMQTPSTRSGRSDLPKDLNRRSSSPGPTRQSPFNSIRAAVEKQRRRSSSREAPPELPYNYDGSIRLFGASPKSSSRSASRESSPQKHYSQEKLRKTSIGKSPQEKKNSISSVKNFGVELKQSGKKIVRQNEQEEEYSAPRHMLPKQVSLNKDFGREAEQARQEVRRSSEGANRRKISAPSSYQIIKPSFGLDFSDKKGKTRNEQKMEKSPRTQNGYHGDLRRESSSSASKVPPKVPPKVHPKTSGKDGKKITIIPIRMSSSSKSEDKQQPLQISQQIQNGYVNEQTSSAQRSRSAGNYDDVRISASSKQLQSSGDSDEKVHKSSQRTRQQLSQDAMQRIRERPEPKTRTRSQGSGPSDSSPRVRTRTRPKETQENFQGYHKERVRSRERRRSTEQVQHKKMANAAVAHAYKYNIDTADVVATPTEPVASPKQQHMPYVGLSPSQSRKVNVQVSTEDYEESCQTEPAPIILRSPQLVRDASTGGGTTNYQAKQSTAIGSLTSIPLSPLSPSPLHIMVSSSSSAPHLSPGPYSPGPASTSIPSSPSPGISRVVPASASIPSSPSPGISRVVQQSHHKEPVEIPLRPNPDQQQQQQQQQQQYQQQQQQQKLQQLPRRRSVVEIQPQPLQTPKASPSVTSTASATTSTSTGGGSSLKIPMMLMKPSTSSNNKGGKHSAQDKNKVGSKSRKFFW